MYVGPDSKWAIVVCVDIVIGNKFCARVPDAIYSIVDVHSALHDNTTYMYKLIPFSISVPYTVTYMPFAKDI